jgi:hypothetical protein
MFEGVGLIVKFSEKINLIETQQFCSSVVFHFLVAWFLAPHFLVVRFLKLLRFLDMKASNPTTIHLLNLSPSSPSFSNNI